MPGAGRRPCSAPGPLPGPAPAVTAPGKLAPGHVQVGAHGAGMLHQARRRIGVAAHRRPAPAKDTGLLAADAFPIRAQPVRVVQIHRGHYGHVGIHEIDCVQASSQPHLQQRHRSPGAADNVQDRQGTKLEEGESNTITGLFHSFESRDQFAVLHLAPVQAQTFVVAPETWRGIRRHPMAGTFQDAGKIGDTGAFAVGAGNRHHRHRQTRQVHAPGDPGTAIQAQIHQLGIQSLLPAKPVGEAKVGRGGGFEVRRVWHRYGVGWWFIMVSRLAMRSRISRRSMIISTVP